MSEALADPLPASPSFVLDLSGEGGLPERFLLGYTAADGGSDNSSSSSSSLVGLAIVAEGAVYSNGTASLKSFVDKPPARKNLSDRDHLRKVRDALAAGASNVAVATPVGGDRLGVSAAAAAAAATLPLKMTKEEAVLTVKEAVKGGSSFVLLATVKLPAVQEASGGLLLGAVRVAHGSGKEADRLRRDAERAAQERAKLKGLLDAAINDKRKVLRKLLERAALVINAKKVMISQLQEEGSGEESSGSARASEEEEEEEGGEEHENVSTAGVGGDSGESGGADGREEKAGGEKTDATTTTTAGRGKGKGKAPLPPRAAATDRSGTREDGRKKRGRTVPGEKGGSCRDPDGVSAAVVRVKDEPGVGGSGGGVFAVPAGTQEVSGDNLLLHVDGVGGAASDARRPKGASASASAAAGRGGGGKAENEHGKARVKTEVDDSNSRSNSNINNSSSQRSSSQQRSSQRSTHRSNEWKGGLGSRNYGSNSDDDVGGTRSGGGGGSRVEGSSLGKSVIDEALKHIGGDSSGSDGGAGSDGGGGRGKSGLDSPPRRRRKRKKVGPASADGGGGGGGGDDGGSSSTNSYGAAGRTATSGTSAKVTAKSAAGSKTEKEDKPKRQSIYAKMLEDDDDSDIDGLQ